MMRTFPKTPKSPKESKYKITTAALALSIPAAIAALAVFNANQTGAKMFLYLYIFAALIGLAAPLSRLNKLREAQSKELLRQMLQDLTYSEDESLFAVACHKGCGVCRCRLHQTGGQFTAYEEDFISEAWQSTGRTFEAADEHSLWRELDREGYSEIAWYEGKINAGTDSEPH